MDGKPYVLAVKALITRADGKCLLVRRSRPDRHFAGQWEWPGGKVDPGEDFVTALHREVAEETGLTVELCGFAGADCFEMPKAQVVNLCMEARATGGTLTLSEEHDAAEWVLPADLPKWDLAPNFREFMLAHVRRTTANPRATGPRTPGMGST